MHPHYTHPHIYLLSLTHTAHILTGLASYIHIHTHIHIHVHTHTHRWHPHETCFTHRHTNRWRPHRTCFPFCLPHNLPYILRLQSIMADVHRPRFLCAPRRGASGGGGGGHACPRQAFRGVKGSVRRKMALRRGECASPDTDQATHTHSKLN